MDKIIYNFRMVLTNNLEHSFCKPVGIIKNYIFFVFLTYIWVTDRGGLHLKNFGIKKI